MQADASLLHGVVCIHQEEAAVRICFGLFPNPFPSVTYLAAFALLHSLWRDASFMRELLRELYRSDLIWLVRLFNEVNVWLLPRSVGHGLLLVLTRFGTRCGVPSCVPPLIAARAQAHRAYTTRHSTRWGSVGACADATRRRRGDAPVYPTAREYRLQGLPQLVPPARRESS